MEIAMGGYYSMIGTAIVNPAGQLLLTRRHSILTGRILYSPSLTDLQHTTGS